MTVRLLHGDCRDVLKTLEDESVHAVVTSPPFFQQRDYDVNGQIGREATPAEFADTLCEVFAAVKRVLRADGSLWLQLGDTYAAGGNGGGGSLVARRPNWRGALTQYGFRGAPEGYKGKDLTLAPFHVADLLRRSGWYLRATIIWDKNGATEVPRLDRPAVAHEYLFLLAKSKRYQVRDPGEAWFRSTVWTIRPQLTHTGHPAVMPAELARRCIVAATAEGETVLDPFAGAGTTLLVADRLGRNAVGIELSQVYVEIARRRIVSDAPLLTEVSAA